MLYPYYVLLWGTISGMSLSTLSPRLFLPSPLPYSHRLNRITIFLALLSLALYNSKVQTTAADYDDGGPCRRYVHDVSHGAGTDCSPPPPPPPGATKVHSLCSFEWFWLGDWCLRCRKRLLIRGCDVGTQDVVWQGLKARGVK